MNTDRTLSPGLFETLKDIEIQDNNLALVLLRTTINLILELGEHEHEGDWDPYILIKLNDGTEIKSTVGYPQLYFEFDGDKTSPMQLDFMKHYKSITAVGIYTHDHFFTEREVSFIPTKQFGKSNIKSISLEDYKEE